LHGNYISLEGLVDLKSHTWQFQNASRPVRLFYETSRAVEISEANGIIIFRATLLFQAARVL
jgi:hypothetical protein